MIIITGNTTGNITVITSNTTGRLVFWLHKNVNVNRKMIILFRLLINATFTSNREWLLDLNWLLNLLSVVSKRLSNCQIVNTLLIFFLLFVYLLLFYYLSWDVTCIIYLSILLSIVRCDVYYLSIYFILYREMWRVLYVTERHIVSE